MSDKPRDPRRVGDETRKRIDNLADGWQVPGSGVAPDPAAPASSAPAKPAPVLPPPRPSPPSSVPPPPPGDPRRSAASAAETSESPASLAQPSKAAQPAKAEQPAKAAQGRSRGKPRSDFDPTVVPGQEAPQPVPSFDGATDARMRAPAALPRKRGWIGDLTYVWRVVFGLAKARRELAAKNDELARERERRLERLINITERLVVDQAIDFPLLAQGRAQVVAIDKRRALKGAVVDGTTAEIAAAQRVHDGKLEETTKLILSHQTEISEIEKKLGPLEKQLSKVRKKATDLKGRIGTYERQIAEAGAESAADVQATLAGLRADRDALIADEPPLAAELAELAPQVEQLTARRDAAAKRVAELDNERTVAAERLAEVKVALEARRIVESRAVTDLDAEKAAALSELGDRLATKSPSGIGDRLAPITILDIAITRLEERVGELTETLDVVDRWKVVRGALLWTMIVAGLVAIGALVALR